MRILEPKVVRAGASARGALGRTRRELGAPVLGLQPRERVRGA